MTSLVWFRKRLLPANPRLVGRLIVFSLASAGFLAVSVFSMRFGSVPISTAELWNALISTDITVARVVVMDIRLPRILLGMLVGMNLACSGALLQAVMGNPLADPGLIGVSTGASLTAVAIMLVFPAYSALVPAAAFIGGLVACMLVYSLAWRKGIDPIRIILAGVAVNAILGGGTALLSILYSDKIQGVLMWLNGSIAGKSWYQVRILLPYSLIGLLCALLCTRTANMLLLGDDVAKNLGLNVNRSRLVLSMIAAFLAGIAVAMVGLIGFVGLVIPHISRMLVGSDYRYLLPLSGILGAMLLIIADAAARSVFVPIELPVGVLMAVLGGPFFLYLLRKGGSYRV